MVPEKVVTAENYSSLCKPFVCLSKPVYGQHKHANVGVIYFLGD